MSVVVPSWLQALILGVVQGLTEFLPVSSSGHLVIAPYLLGLEPPTLAFGVLLHVATLLAVITYFRSELGFLARGVTGVGAIDVVHRRAAARTVGLLAIGSVPVAAAGLLLGDLVGGAFERPRTTAVALLVTAGLLVFAEQMRRDRAASVEDPATSATVAALDPGRGEGEVTLVDAAVIGCGQALAIVPGISRAGATIATGMVRGLSRTAASRFSFLLSIPAIAGAGLVELGEYEPGSFGGYSTVDVLVGSISAGLAGFWAIRFLLRLVTTDDLGGFARYLVLLAVVVLVVSLAAGSTA